MNKMRQTGKLLNLGWGGGEEEKKRVSCESDWRKKTLKALLRQLFSVLWQ